MQGWPLKHVYSFGGHSLGPPLLYEGARPDGQRSFLGPLFTHPKGKSRPLTHRCCPSAEANPTAWKYMNFKTGSKNVLPDARKWVTTIMFAHPNRRCQKEILAKLVAEIPFSGMGNPNFPVLCLSVSPLLPLVRMVLVTRAGNLTLIYIKMGAHCLTILKISGRY